MFDPACHVLAVILARHFSNRFACTIQDVVDISSMSDLPIPIQAEHLCDLSEALSARTKILFLKNTADPRRSWIVLDIYALLHNINGKIFAPKGFAENVFRPTSTGVLPWSQLTKEFPNLDPYLIVSFLGRLEFCQVISDSEVLDLIKGKVSLIGQSSDNSDSDSGSDIEIDSPTAHRPYSSSRRSSSSSSSSQKCKQDFLPQYPSVVVPAGPATCPQSTSEAPCCFPPPPHRSYPNLDLAEKYLFFPGLISPEQPRQDMWSSDDFEYYSGWCLKCVSDQQFFSLRFLHTLLLRLAFSFALTKSARGLEQVECTLWKNGLRWLNLDGIETIVEVVEDRKAVLLLTRMKERSTGRGVQLRSAIIQKVLDTKKEYCMQVATAESFIDPSHLKARQGYPVINKKVHELKRYGISLLSEAFCSKSK